MVQDPYKVLGITKDATPEEIKSAYRKMAKKYHPDLHPNDEAAALKMNEVNEAYDMLNHPEKYARRQYEDTQRNSSSQYGGYSSYGNPFGGFGSFYGRGANTGNSQNGYHGAGGWYSDFSDFEDFFNFGRAYGGQTQNVNINPDIKSEDGQTVREAINLINTGRYAEAIRVLMQVRHTERDARWYYLNSLALYGYQDISQAAEYIAKAVQMEPGNSLYVSLLQKFRAEGRTYYQTTTIMHPFRRLGRIILFFILLRFALRILAALFAAGGGLFLGF